MKTFLLLESGATKMEWVVATQQEILIRGQLSGLHPFLSAREDWERTLNTLRDLLAQQAFDVIHFYATGCTQQQGCNIVRAHLLATWPGCQDVVVESDLVAAARACWHTEAGVVCILGSGSNVAYYDGEKIKEQRGGLGYVLGDEGAGADLGRILLAAHLNGDLPSDLSAELLHVHGLDRGEVISSLYQHPSPSRYLAQFAPIVKEWIGRSAYLEVAVMKRYRLLVAKFLLPLCRSYDVPKVAFVGSVAVHFKPQIELALQEKSLGIKKIIGAPIDNLISFHQQVLR